MMRFKEDNVQLREQMAEHQQELLNCDKKLKRLENEVEWLTKELQIILQPKKKAARKRWKVDVDVHT